MKETKSDSLSHTTF